MLREFRCLLDETDWSHFSHKTSPSRLLSDLFWLKLPWQAIQQELGKIKVYDIGCGKGKYGLMLQDLSGNRISSYTGIDVKYQDTWNELQVNRNNVTFITAHNTKAVITNIPTDINLIISQSALEHIEEDLTLFKGIRDYITRTNRNIIQIHLIPSESCLDLYRYHGVRQYSPRSLSKISKMFNHCSYSMLYKLGGQAGYDLHLEYITYPIMKSGKDLREFQTENYYKLLKITTLKDMETP